MKDRVLAEFGFEYNSTIKNMLWKQGYYGKQAFVRI